MLSLRALLNPNHLLFVLINKYFIPCVYIVCSVSLSTVKVAQNGPETKQDPLLKETKLPLNPIMLTQVCPVGIMAAVHPGLLFGNTFTALPYNLLWLLLGHC